MSPSASAGVATAQEATREIDALRALRAVSAARSFHKAAAELGVSRTTLRARIERLERWSGHPLLIRDATGVRLTARGEQLLRHAERLLQEANLLESRRWLSDQEPGGRMNIYVQEGVLHLPVLVFLRRAAAHFPRLSFRILRLASNDQMLLRELAQEGMGVCLVPNPPLPAVAAKWGELSVVMADTIGRTVPLTCLLPESRRDSLNKQAWQQTFTEMLETLSRGGTGEA